MTDHRRPLRSWLFTPATRPERFAKATEVGADVLILDLEDAVAPKDKERARGEALAYLAQKHAIPTALRVNSLRTRFGLADVDALLTSDATPEFVVLPKTDSAVDLALLDRLFGEAGKAAKLIALIESATALSNLETIAQATPRLAGLLFGAADMAADLGAAVGWEPLLNARSRLVAAAALSGAIAIDTPFFDIHDLEGLSAEVERSIALGFAGKTAIHPDQVKAINDALTPTPGAVAHAKAILAENAEGVGVIDGRMIDEAVARHARRTLAAAGEAA